MTTKTPASLRILVAHGVNLDLLGKRETAIYGNLDLATINAMLAAQIQPLAKLCRLPNCQLTFFQTNEESLYLNKFDESWHGALINPGAWSHTSLALADRLAGLQLPYVEVHLSNLAKREEFRHRTYTSPHATGVVYGFGAASYLTGLYGLLLSLVSQGKFNLVLPS